MPKIKNRIVNGKIMVNKPLDPVVFEFFSKAGKKGHAIAKKDNPAAYKKSQRDKVMKRWKNHKKAPR
jgi:hypothetical protein